MESSESMFSPTSLLLCKENLASLDIEDEEIVQEDYDEEYIKMLFDRENTGDGLQMQELLQNSLVQRARLEGIQYILRMKEHFGFGFQTAYASVTYLDRFLSKRSVDGEECWAIRLLSMACVSLAAKMEENRVPALSELCGDDYYFESSVIQRMELLVLNTLEWRMGSLTPFAFVHFFANKFRDNSLPRNGLSRIVQLILGATRDARITCDMPSVIAAAATLIVLDQGLTSDALLHIIGPLTSTHSLKVENIISCYNRFQKMDIQKLKLSQGIESPDLSPIQLQPYGSSSITPAGTAKRKRLVFNEEADHFGDVHLPDKKGKP